jgi:quercetin dioxygenase-like cupin family protein
MALHHAASGELISVRPLGHGLRNEVSKALFKSKHLEVLRMVLPAGEAVPPHAVMGELTVQCLEGSIEFTAAGATRTMREGDLICLEACEGYAIKALEDTSCLVSIVLHTG